MAVVAVTALLAGCSGTPAPPVTVTVTSTVTASPESVRPRGLDPNIDSVLDGTWLVGTDIVPGQYIPAVDPIGDCRWEVRDKDDNAVAEGMSAGTRPSIRLEPGDMFTSAWCLVWSRQDPSVTPGQMGIQEEQVGPVLNDQGLWLAGEQIAPGTYQVVDPPTGGAVECAWSVQEVFGPEGIKKYSELASEKYTDRGKRVTGQWFVEVEQGDVFQTDGCGRWQRIEYGF